MQEIENYDIGAVSKGINLVPSFVKIYQTNRTLNRRTQTKMENMATR
jgi:hypothetical protein